MTDLMNVSYDTLIPNKKMRLKLLNTVFFFLGKFFEVALV